MARVIAWPIIGYGSPVSIIDALVVAMGCLFVAAGVITAAKFGAEVIRPRSEEVRRVRPWFGVIVFRYLGSGLAFIAAGVARSRTAFICGVFILIATGASDWFLARRYERVPFRPDR